MLTLFSRLLAGDAGIADIFAKAKVFWNGFYEAHGGGAPHELAALLSQVQTRFYWDVVPDDYPFAKEIMALTAIGSLYDDVNGFGDTEELARTMVAAFRASEVSIEVKHGNLDRVAAVYGLSARHK